MSDTVSGDFKGGNLIMTAIILSTVKFIENLFTNLLLVPARSILAISSTYLASIDISFISIIGLVLLLVLASYTARFSVILLKNVILHVIFLYQERKREEIREIKRREREKTEARLKANREFDELYEAYVVRN